MPRIDPHARNTGLACATKDFTLSYEPKHIYFNSVDLSPTAQDFIVRRIVSVEQLEVLLLLYEARDRDWSAPEINARLRSQTSSIAKWLESLESQGLATRADGRYRYSAASEELQHGLGAAVSAYREQRIKVIELIFSKPNETLLSFIRAFDLRKRP